ncbi:MAG: hypothetical protein MUC65_00195 [Pontiellaceae bacterium]|jgi:hypothetical protein|nr:hypothetical protein [Pontiellaceae bacterium]
MNFQVDFLKKTERRYQGVVSMKVMALGSMSVLVGIAVVVFTLAGISKMSMNADLGRARSEWSQLSPQAARIQACLAAIDTNKSTLSRLESWSEGEKLSMYSVLREVQREIPVQMALGNFFAGLEDPVDPAGAVSRLIRLSGRAAGEMTAVDAKRQLNDNRVVRGFCGEIRLVSSQRESGGNWIFSMEGRRPVDGGTP